MSDHQILILSLKELLVLHLVRFSQNLFGHILTVGRKLHRHLPHSILENLICLYHMINVDLLLLMNSSL